MPTNPTYTSHATIASATANFFVGLTVWILMKFLNIEVPTDLVLGGAVALTPVVSLIQKKLGIQSE